jgi:predicted phage terminase large subunit-like protein
LHKLRAKADRDCPGDKKAAETLFNAAVKYRASIGDLLCYILYVHGKTHPDIRSFCYSKHAYVMASYLETSDRTAMVTPPEHGKTLLHRSEMELWLGTETEKCYANADYTVPSAVYVMATFENQAEDQVFEIRQTIEHNKRFRELFPHARPDKKGKWERGKFFLQRPEGRSRPEPSLMGIGIGGDIQGARFGKGTVDDPIDQRKAKSDGYVKDTVRWLLATFESRILRGGPKRYVFTRWAEHDAFDPLSKICSPLVMPVYGFWEAHPEYGCQADSLWPDKWPKAAIETEKRIPLVDAGEAALWPLVWLCDPKQATGTIFKRENFRYSPIPEDLFVVQGVDPAIGVSTRADYFVVATVGLHLATRRFYILDILRTRAEAPDQPEILLKAYDQWKPTVVGIESIFFQASLFQTMRREGTLPLREIARRAGGTVLRKVMRLQGLAERYKVGQIIHPDNNPPWLQDYETELCSINYVEGKETHAHDDQPDGVELAVQMLSGMLRSQTQFREPTAHSFTYY